ncbi:alpha/beta hydrolase [Clostridium sp. ASF356]|nr:alpha/beta hydrolase [Clostridium sp. MD294]
MEEYYIFELSDAVDRTSVHYKNRYGIELSADLYTSKYLDKTQTYPAIVIGPPYGGVKEQGPGVYANQLAQRGFIVLAFDPSYNGESGGEPRHISSPEIFSEDFSAGVDYLGSLDYVNREQIGAIGICGSGGFALSAAAMDTRIKAVATAAMYDISAMGNTMDNESRNAMIKSMSEQRWQDFENGEAAYTRNYPLEAPLDELPEDLSGLNIEWWTFYGLKRGWHPNSGGSFTDTSMLPFTNYSLLNHIDSISPRPILFITGDIAHSKEFSETAYQAAEEPKELYVVPSAMHIDLYDDTNKIPFDKLETFFKDAFK